MEIWEQFLWGFGASLFVELLAIHHDFSVEPSLSPKYAMPLYWCNRVLIAAGAGFVPVAYGVDSPMLAMQLGASAPLILEAMQRGVSASAAIRAGGKSHRQAGISPDPASRSGIDGISAEEARDVSVQKSSQAERALGRPQRVPACPERSKRLV